MSAILRMSARSVAVATKTCARAGVPLAMRAGLVSVRFNSTEAAPAAEAAKPVSPKIEQIVDEISKLTLVETSELISALKTKLDIPDMAFPAAGAVAAAPAAGSAGAEEEAPQEQKKEKTIFNVKLESFDAKTKAKIIKEVKSDLGLSLVQAKKLVESAPKVIKENLSKEDAEKMKETLEKLGAKVTLE